MNAYSRRPRDHITLTRRIIIMARTTFSGPVRSLRGFLGSGPAMNTGTIGAGTVDGGTDIAGIDLYQGKVVQLGNNTVVFNLPEIITTATSAVAGANDPNSQK